MLSKYTRTSTKIESGQNGMQYPENIFQTFIILILRLKECSAFSILMEEICVVSQQRTYNPQRWLERRLQDLVAQQLIISLRRKKNRKNGKQAPSLMLAPAFWLKLLIREQSVQSNSAGLLVKKIASLSQLITCTNKTIRDIVALFSRFSQSI